MVVSQNSLWKAPYLGSFVGYKTPGGGPANPADFQGLGFRGLGFRAI